VGKVIRPVFGKPCRECGEQIEMRRLRAKPDAIRCYGCQHEKDMRVKQLRRIAGPRDTEIVRG